MEDASTDRDDHLADGLIRTTLETREVALTPSSQLEPVGGVSRVRAWFQHNFLAVLGVEAVVGGTAIVAPPIPELWGCVATLAAVVGSILFIRQMDLTVAKALLETVVTLEESGDYAGTLETYHELASDCRDPLSRVYLASSQAYVLLRSGDPCKAAALYEEIRKLRLRPLRATVEANLALAYAVAGDMSAATQHLPPTPVLVGAEHAVVWARLGETTKVRTLAPPPPPRGIRKLLRHEKRVVALMKAFVAPDERWRKRWLDDARQAHDGELDYLATSWPELRSFLDEHEPALRPASRPLPPARVVPKKTGAANGRVRSDKVTTQTNDNVRRSI